MSYATSEQLTTYLGTPAPEDAARLLARASELVDDHIVNAVYDVDDDGFPTKEPTVGALRDATCAQVEYWLAGDEEDDILGPVDSASAGGQQLQFGSSTNRPTPMYLAPRAARALRRGGLLGGAVRSSW